MFVVLIIGILLAIVLPVIAQASSHAERKTCFANQRTIEGAVMVWQLDPARQSNVSVLAGLVNGAHELVTGNFITRPPRCPSAPRPADISNPTAAEGAYTLSATATVAPCSFGSLGAHGSFHDQ
jgi:type II secretory pathway pseudopilin PulG